jgi:amidase
MSPTTPVDDPFNAFCTDTEAFLPGAATGPLAGLSFAAKDIFDVAGHVCGCGNPDWKATHESAKQTAWAVQVLVDAGATMVGKTHTEELTRGIFGENAHYGTPVNPKAPGRVPGGSSSGSAAAVAGGLVDFALGSDTGGSVRIPASFCGLYGLRPTHGRIPLDGVLNGSKTYDTVGYFTRDAELFARVGQVLLQSPIQPARPSRLVVAEDAFEVADAEVVEALRPRVDEIASLIGKVSNQRLSPNGLQEWAHQQGVLAGCETLESNRDWIDRVNPRFGFEVAMRYTSADAFSAADLEAARVDRERIRARVNEVMDADTVMR